MPFPEDFGHPRQTTPQSFTGGIPNNVRVGTPGIAILGKQLFQERITGFGRSFQTPQYVENGSYPFAIDSAVPAVSVGAQTVYTAPVTGDTTLTIDSAVPAVSVTATSP